MKIFYILIIYIACILLVNCKSSKIQNEYDDLEHIGVKNIHITKIDADTIIIDGSATSLQGKWSINKGKLYYTDYSLVGVREFDLNGNFVERHINTGRGPNEWHSPFLATCFDSHDNLIGIDGNCFINMFDSTYNKISSPYKLLSDLSFDTNDLNYLLSNPDVEVTQMYGFNFDSRRVVTLGDSLLVIPIVTEHPDYNGYYTNSNTRDFWQNSYTYIFINKNNLKTEYKFGHYPHVYTTCNIPAFSKYSLDVSSYNLFTAFSADSLIYVRDSKGNLIYSMGYGSDGIDYNYPETKSFEEFSSVFKDHLKEFAYYLDIKVIDSYVFRSYKLKKDLGYGIQIYRDGDLIGDVHTDEDTSIIGMDKDIFYGALPADIENDCFKIIKFKL